MRIEDVGALGQQGADLPVPSFDELESPGPRVHDRSLDTRFPAAYARSVVAALAVLTLLPNLVELPPASVQVQHAGGRDILRFTSTAANAGPGALVVVSTRRSVGAPFATSQLIGRARLRVPLDLRYRRSGGHDHFHLARFERYELRDGAGKVLLSDRKVGFCLGDRLALPGAVARRPRFTGGCGRGDPGALRILQGISPGYADPYDAELDGQSLDVTGLPAGEYVLVNEVNPDRLLRETRYDDDAAAVRFRLTTPARAGGSRLRHRARHVSYRQLYGLTI